MCNLSIIYVHEIIYIFVCMYVCIAQVLVDVGMHAHVYTMYMFLFIQ